jgi:hypothetical protein
MNIEDEIINEAGKQMAVGIDFEILTSMLVDACGWYRVEIIDRPEPGTAIDIFNWVSEHCKGKHMKHQRTYVFENQGDAVNFTLRWL